MCVGVEVERGEWARAKAREDRERVVGGGVDWVNQCCSFQEV